jgi:rSAM/selenodomain-associated transferase 2
MISIIIPTYNEAAHIKTTLTKLREFDKDNQIKEIIVSDGGSTDATRKTAESVGVKVVRSKQKGRAAQMNFGALHASGKVLYFLHADTLPPPNFGNEILTTLSAGFSAGCYMLSFDHDHWFLKANCWFTRFDVDAVRFGDQSLFVTKEKFFEVGGFCEKYIILEDQQIIKRLKEKCRFNIIKKPVVTSARKYRQNGIYKTQGIFFLIYFLYRLGFSQQNLLTIYRTLIQQDKF